MKRLALILFALMAVPAAANDFSGWAAVIAAGDSFSSDRKETAVFDNGRKTLFRELVLIGFSPGNIVQFTDWPERFGGKNVRRATPTQLGEGLTEVTGRAKAGCLVYLTSHGGPDGIAFGGALLSPQTLKTMLDKSCAERPTVVVVSACYSGVFVPYLKAPNRLVVTAAAKDRSSFGCGATDQYTYFDYCVLQSLPQAGDFTALTKKVKSCVEAREIKEAVKRPSDPQVDIGQGAETGLPHW